MKKKKTKGIRVGIVGYGFVGKAVEFGFKTSHNAIKIIDPNLDTTTADLLNWHPDVTFICVPTPMSESGSIDSSIIETVMEELRDVPGIVVIKSTITPDLADKLCHDHDIVYNPEFLTEKNALVDFVNPPMHVLGGSPIQTHTIELWYNMYSTCNTAPAFHMTPAEASFVKYGVNSFLATKVLWFNQYKDLIEKHGGNYNSVIKAISQDDRIGPSHTKVPGTDGRKGYGGACFPKDTNALLNFSENTFSVLASVIEANNEYRDQYDLDDREKEQNVVYLAGKIVKMSK